MRVMLKAPAATVFLLAPALAVLAVGFVWPVAWFVTFGLRNYSLGAEDFGGLPQLWTITAITFLLGFWTTLSTLIIGYPIAYFLVRSQARWRFVILFIIFVPLMFSVVVRTFGWIVLLGSEGLLNRFLVGTGLLSAPRVWLYNMPATVAGLVHVLLPFMVLSIVTSLGKIEPQVEEAAAILGATPRRILYRVTLPLSAQGVFGGCAIVFSLAVGSYVTPKLIGGGRVPVMATEIYGQMLDIGDWRSAALLGVLLTALTLMALSVYRLSMRRQPEAA